jgi:cysteine-rich repeat protein
MKLNWMILALAFAALACAVAEPGPGTGTDAGPTNICGNGVVEDGEQCDDTNTRNRDGCDRECQNEGGARCGDGVVSGDEECDDGNTIPGDGCDNRCNSEDVADNNDTRETAQIIEGNQVEGVIATPGDVDWYRFDAEEGDWVAAWTSANPDDDSTKIDTVITLYDADGNQIAENDDAHPRRNTDSQLLTRLPGAGTYYMQVQEWSSWQNETAEGQRDYTYTLSINVLSTEEIGGGVIYAEEAGNDAESATPLEAEKSMILGGFDDGADVDLFSFSVEDAEKVHFKAQLMPTGTDGYGSTASGSRMWITNGDGAVVARITHAGKMDEVSPGGLAIGDYLLWIARGEGGAGSNDFYAMKFGLVGDNPQEISEDNATLELAQQLESNVQGESTSYFILANMGMDDVDYFGFELAEGLAVSVACGSASGGSGVLGFRAELRNASDEVIGGQVEGDEGILIAQIDGQAAGTYYLRLSSTGQSEEVSGSWARCGVHTGAMRRR